MWRWPVQVLSTSLKINKVNASLTLCNVTLMLRNVYADNVGLCAPKRHKENTWVRKCLTNVSATPSSKEPVDVTSAKTPVATTTTAKYSINNNVRKDEWPDCWSKDEMMYLCSQNCLIVSLGAKYIAMCCSEQGPRPATEWSVFHFCLLKSSSSSSLYVRSLHNEILQIVLVIHTNLLKQHCLWTMSYGLWI